MTVFSKKLYLLIIFLILTSCSFKFLVIPNLAYLISEGIDQKLDLSYSQEEAVKSLLWHYLLAALAQRPKLPHQAVR